MAMVENREAMEGEERKERRSSSVPSTMMLTVGVATIARCSEGSKRKKSWAVKNSKRNTQSEKLKVKSKRNQSDSK